MSQKCPFCEGEKRIKNNGTYSVLNGDKETVVSRFYCGGCGKSFSEHTKGIQRRDKKTDKIIFLRGQSAYRKAKKEKVYSAIDDYITSYGFPKLDDLVAELHISPKTYYRYLSELAYRFKNDFSKERKSLQLKELLLLEWVKVHRITKEKIRFLMLIDLTSKVIFDFFFYEKKLPRTNPVPNEATFEQKALWFGQHTYNSPLIERHLTFLETQYPNLKIQLACSDYLKKRLLKAKPSLFKNADRRTLVKFRSDIRDYGMDRVLAFAWTLFGKAVLKKRAHRTAPKREIKETIKTLVAVYNRHQFETFKRKMEATHRRRSRQKKAIHIVRRKKSS
jgi:hypothetical protein